MDFYRLELVDQGVGGVLSDEARELITRFHRFEKGLDVKITKRFKSAFEDK